MKQMSFLMLVLTGLAHSATISPASISASSTFFTYDPQSLIDGSGLANSLHDSNFANMWLSDNAFIGVDPFSGSLQILFSNVETVASIRIWNYNYDGEGQNPDLLDRGARDVLVSYVLSGVETSLGTFTLSRGTGKPLLADLFVFSAPVVASEFRLSLQTNYGDRDYVGLSEIQFLTPQPVDNNPSPSQVPEPAAWLTCAAPLAWLALRRRTGEGSESKASQSGLIRKL